MAFIQECFVRNPKNKFRQIVELVRLGYRAMYMVWRNNIEGANLVCEGQTWHCTDSDNKPWCIDCGTNEEMFLAIAALRDDTDYMQWFICGDNESMFKVDKPDMSVEKYIHEYMDEWDTEGYRKATAEEIVEHFKEENYDNRTNSRSY